MPANRYDKNVFMFGLDLSWWEFVARAIIVVYGFLMLLVRLSGKRMIGHRDALLLS